jgi:hypothetical protein
MAKFQFTNRDIVWASVALALLILLVRERVSLSVQWNKIRVERMKMSSSWSQMREFAAQYDYPQSATLVPSPSAPKK